MGDGKTTKVEAIGTFRLLLQIGVYLDLKETYVVPSFRRNLISISVLNKSGYYCSFGNSKFSLSLNSNVIGTGSLSVHDNLYLLDIVASFNETLYTSIRGTKRKLTNKDFVMLWHKRLGHISKQRIQRLVSDEILDSLNKIDFQVCSECIKGKQIEKRKLGANRCTYVLELIHIDICGPFPIASWNGQQYFIAFIVDYSRYGYLYLIHEKSQALDLFKSFKVEVELQLGKKIKVVKYDRGGEYYSRYEGSGEQRLGPFAIFLKECGIVLQYTISGKLTMNGVSKRRN